MIDDPRKHGGMNWATERWMAQDVRDNKELYRALADGDDD